MNKLIFAAAVAALSVTSPATAQSAQERLDDRYDRALAAGYKALMLCSATANAELFGAERTPETVHEWELSGIQAPLDAVVRDLPYKIVRAGPDRIRDLLRPAAEEREVTVDDLMADIDPGLLEADDGRVRHVLVEWADDMPPRIAIHLWGRGCTLMPIGWEESELDPKMDVPPFAPYVRPMREIGESSGPHLEAGRAAFDSVTYGEGSRTTAVLVMRGGSPVFEDYAEGFGPRTPQRTWSVAKSIAATVVGNIVLECRDCAEQSGPRPAAPYIETSSALAGEEPAPDWGLLDRGIVLDWTPSAIEPRRQVTVDHLLRMASGRYSDTQGNRTDPLYWGGTTVDERAANWPLVHQPGTVFRYANNDTLMAIWAFRDHLRENDPIEILSRIDMYHTIPETDWQGNYVLSSQVWSTARDLAALGQLYLDDGVWNGERILPEGWVEYVSTPSGPQPEGTNWGYGAGWWTFRRPEGNAFEGIPDDAFAARGNRGQYVVVVPSRDVVIVRRGEDMVGTRFDIAAFTRDVLAALEE